MKNLILILLSITLTTNSSIAQDALFVDKGEVAPFSGILLTKERAEKAIKAEKKVVVLEDLRLTEKQLKEHYKSVAKEERKQRLRSELNNNIKNIGYFALGTILAAFSFRVVQKVGDI